MRLINTTIIDDVRGSNLFLSLFSIFLWLWIYSTCIT